MVEAALLARFNEAARRVITLADQEAVRFCHDFTGTEHLLLALLRLPSCVAVRVLARLGIEPAQVRRAVEEVSRIDHDSAPEDRPLTPRAQQVLQHAIGASERQGQPRAGTGHLLLGLLEDSDGVAHHVLHDLGAVRPGQGLAPVAALVAAEIAVGPEAERPEEPLPDLAPEVLRAMQSAGPPAAGGAAGGALPRPNIVRPLDLEDQAGVLLLGAARGALRGLGWSLLAALLVAVSLWRPQRGGAERALSIAGLTVLGWVFVSALLGALRARAQTRPDDYDALVRLHVWRAAGWATLILAPLALVLLSETWDREPARAIWLAMMVLGLGVAVSALIGLGRGTRAAQELQKRDSEAVLGFVASGEAREKLARWDASTLAHRRGELQHAIEARFGPLDQAAREQLQTWDQDRLLEAQDKLAAAGSPGELGLDDRRR
jgi:hypothetical protein